jgi:steroid 5-alpha reductase family enzyme
MDIFLTTLLHISVVILGYMTFLYLLSMILKRSDIVDIGWGLGFIVTTLISALLATNITMRMIAIGILIALWGLRLAIHIFLRNRNKDEDFRYKKFKKDWGENFWWKSYINIFLLQGLLMMLISIPIIYLFTFSLERLSWLTYTGIGIWVLGFLFEVISDWQLSRFIDKKKQQKAKERFLKTGLWSLSRHPNYFGEVLLWWGIWLASVSLSNPTSLLTVIGPITITYFITQVSGVPILEKKYEGDKEWEMYKKRVPKFIPIKLK